MNKRQVKKDQDLTLGFSNLESKTSKAHHFCFCMKKQINRVQANASKADKFRTRALLKGLHAKPVNLSALFISGRYLK